MQTSTLADHIETRTVLYVEPYGENDGDFFGRVIDVEPRYATLLLTDEEGNPHERPVSVADAQGIDLSALRWSTSYWTREHLARPVVDDFGNVVTKPSGITYTVYAGKIQQTAAEIKAEREARQAEAAKARAESRRKGEQADLILKPLRDLLPDYIAHSHVIRAYDADSAFDLYNAIVKDAEVEEIQPNVYSVKVKDTSRYGGSPQPIEDTVVHLVDADTYSVLGERTSFDPNSDRQPFGLNGDAMLVLAALLVHRHQNG